MKSRRNIIRKNKKTRKNRKTRMSRKNVAKGAVANARKLFGSVSLSL